MGKTRDDEAYERGFKAGKAGGILDDIAQNLSRPLDFTKQDEIYNKGYREGAGHRYDNSSSSQEIRESAKVNREESTGESSYGGGSSYGDSYGSGGGGGSYSSSNDRAFSAIMWTIISLPFVAAFLLMVYIGIAEEKGWPLPGVNCPTPLQKILASRGIGSAIQTPRTGPQLTRMYFCTEENYKPDEWRVTPKTVSRTPDGGKTWHTIYSLKKYTIRGMETRDTRGVESLRPGERDIFLIIEEP